MESILPSGHIIRFGFSEIISKTRPFNKFILMYILYIYIGLKQSNGFRTTNEEERIKSHPSILYHSVKLSLTSYKQMGKRFLSVHQLSREYRAFSIGLSEITRLNDFMNFKMVFSCPWQSLWRKLLLRTKGLYLALFEVK